MEQQITVLASLNFSLSNKDIDGATYHNPQGLLLSKLFDLIVHLNNFTFYKLVHIGYCLLRIINFSREFILMTKNLNKMSILL